MSHSRLAPVWSAYCLQCVDLNLDLVVYSEAEKTRDAHTIHKVVGIHPFLFSPAVQTVPLHAEGATMMRGTLYSEFSHERENQDRLKAMGRFRYTCADPEAGHEQCFAVLLEEIGEVGQAIAAKSHDAEFSSLARRMATLGEVARGVLNAKGLSNDPPGPHRPDRDARKELVQSASVIVAWLEGYEEKM